MRGLFAPMSIQFPGRKAARVAASVISAVLAFMALGGAGGARAGAFDDFSLGANAEHQPCRGVWRFESAKTPSAVDVYCGAWEAPSGTVRLIAPGAEPAVALARECARRPGPGRGRRGRHAHAGAVRAGGGADRPGALWPDRQDRRARGLRDRVSFRLGPDGGRRAGAPETGQARRGGGFADGPHAGPEGNRGRLSRWAARPGGEPQL